MTAPKQKRAPAKSALRKLRLIGSYHASALLANIFGSRFGFLSSADGGSRIGSTTRVCGHE